jgi:hypothetical protein
MRNIFYTALLLLSVVSCSSHNEDIEHYIGLYRVVESSCELEEDAYDPCKYTHFFEIVKGQFIGIGNNEIGYVFWSGDPKIDPELQYSAHTIRNPQSQVIADNRYYLDNSETSEYLVFSSGVLTAYHAIYETTDKSSQRKISYKFKEVKRGSLPSYRLNYPGNQ